MKKYDYLIVGAGLFGSVFAYEANKLNKKCLVMDKREHIAGNIYTKNIENINVVWKKLFIEYLSRKTGNSKK